MATPYDEALCIVERIAHDVCGQLVEPVEQVALEESVGRIAARSLRSPVATPAFDTSAMDGYAISSQATMDASEDNPAIFTVKDTIAAGDDPVIFSTNSSDGTSPCFAIMTGARFPYGVSGLQFDACVKIENTFRVAKSTTSEQQIKVVQPVPLNANRRFAGSDYQEGDLLLMEGQIIRSRHIMALASVGIAKVDVRRRLRVAIWSTGNELTKNSSDSATPPQTMDINGPFLTAALLELGVKVDFQGILEDNPNHFMRAVNEKAGREEYDILLTTGAVSKGQLDFIPSALEVMGANIHFHGVAIRPGHPVLFASLPLEKRSTPIFGLPGNPIATAACFQFLVSPFIRQLMGLEQLRPYPAKVETQNGPHDNAAGYPSYLDGFRHGCLRRNNSDKNVVVLNEDQSPAKVSHFAMSDCWAHIPKRPAEDDPNSIMYCYLHPSHGLE